MQRLQPKAKQLLFRLLRRTRQQHVQSAPSTVLSLYPFCFLQAEVARALPKLLLLSYYFEVPWLPHSRPHRCPKRFQRALL